MATPKVKEFDPDPAINLWMNASIRPRRPVFHEGSSRKRARLEKHGGDIIELEDDTTAAPGPAQSRQEADVMDVEEDATATPEPSQPLFPKLEEEGDEDEDEVLFREKVDDDGEDERVISDYESKAEMSEEMVLDKLEKFLL